MARWTAIGQKPRLLSRTGIVSEAMRQKIPLILLAVALLAVTSFLLWLEYGDDDEVTMDGSSLSELEEESAPPAARRFDEKLSDQSQPATSSIANEVAEDRDDHEAENGPVLWSGRVVDDLGLALVDVKVMLFEARRDDPFSLNTETGPLFRARMKPKERTRSAADGSFGFRSKIRAGNWLLAKSTATGIGMLSPELPRQKLPESPTIVIARHLPYAGVVLSPEGKPVAKAIVTLHFPESSKTKLVRPAMPIVAISAGDGSFRMPGSSKYDHIEVEHSEYALYQFNVTPEGTVNHWVRKALDKVPEKIELVRGRRLTIHFTGADSDTSPADFNWRLTGITTKLNGVAKLNASVVIPHFPMVKQFYLSSDHPEYRVVRKDRSADLDPRIGVRFGISPKGPVECHVKLEKGGTIRGQVVDSQGLPISGLKLRWFGRSLNKVVGPLDRTTLSDGNGNFLFRGIPATTVFMTLATEDYVLRSFKVLESAGSHPGKALPVLNLRNSTKAVINLVVERAATVRGRVRDQSGKGLAEYIVQLARETRSSNSEFFHLKLSTHMRREKSLHQVPNELRRAIRQVVSDADGRFLLAGLSPALGMRLEAIHRLGPLGGSFEFDLEAGETKNVDIQIGNRPKVTVCLTLEGGNPVVDFPIKMQQMLRSDGPRRQISNHQVTVRTNAEGLAVFEHLNVGIASASIDYKLLPKGWTLPFGLSNEIEVREGGPHANRHEITLVQPKFIEALVDFPPDAPTGSLMHIILHRIDPVSAELGHRHPHPIKVGDRLRFRVRDSATFKIAAATRVKDWKTVEYRAISGELLRFGAENKVVLR